MPKTKPGRRHFLKISLLTGGALLVGTQVLTCCSHHPPRLESGGTFLPNAWIRIDPDNRITVIIDRSEMGQGVVTALSMLIAEELEVEVARLAFTFAPVDPVYNNSDFHLQATGGSTSIKTAWLPLREAGAMTRMLLIAAAAEQWGIPATQCHAQAAEVIHPDGHRLSYGQLTTRAVSIPVPDSIPLKKNKDFKTIGSHLPRLDTAPKLDGSARFGMDVRLPGMLRASIAQCPVFGGRLLTFEAKEVLRRPGVRQVVALDNAIAVVAEYYWQAKKGLDQLLQHKQFKWDLGPRAGVSSASIQAEFKAQAKEQAQSARTEGNAKSALTKAAKVLRAEYQLPYLAHATMEPMNCTAEVQTTSAEIWVPTQNQSGTQETVAQITGLSHKAIKVHTTFLGGGFGRRGEQDFVAQAVQIAQQVDAPVQLIWSREEDTQHDFYRPATYHNLVAGLDKKGHPQAWTHHIIGPSILSRVIPELVPATLPPWLPHGVKRTAGGLLASLSGLSVDQGLVEGASEIPYALPHIQVDYTEADPGVPVGFWRSVGHSHNAFVVESFIDELAHAAGNDPYRFRRGLLTHAPLYVQVLDKAAQQAGWEKTPAEGHFRGIALHASFGSYVAQVAEISINVDQTIRVHRVVCAINCGTVINPGIVQAQMESGIVYGLTAALLGEITLDSGRVVQSNFHDYPVLSMSQMPKIDVYMLASIGPPMGVGEPGTPPIAPAVSNAVFAATGQRLRRLPLRLL